MFHYLILPLIHSFIILSITSLFYSNTLSAKQRIIIDADTANEVDDLYAVVRCLIEPRFDVVGLNSTQWQYSHWSVENSLEESQRLNVLLLAYLEKTSIPHPRGSHFRLYDWGQDVAQHSAAAYHIIKEAHKTPDVEKLVVFCLGALTNISSAILIDPSIVDKISLYMLGTTYDFDKQIWRKRDFNCIMDIQALEEIFNTEGLETHVMPVNMASAMTFEYDDIKRRFSGKHDLLEFLRNRWFEHIDSGRYKRVIWDLSLIEAFLYPEMAEKMTAKTPPENSQRNVNVYKSIDANAMRQDFYKTISNFFEHLKVE